MPPSNINQTPYVTQPDRPRDSPLRECTGSRRHSVRRRQDAAPFPFPRPPLLPSPRLPRGQPRRQRRAATQARPPARPTVHDCNDCRDDPGKERPTPGQQRQTAKRGAAGGGRRGGVRLRRGGLSGMWRPRKGRHSQEDTEPQQSLN